MSTDPKMLENFVRIGQEILSCDWTVHYGPDIARVAPSPPGIGYAQPGFIGHDYRGIVFIAQNPGVGANRAEEHRLWKQVFRNWNEKGTVAAYSEVFEFWRRDLNGWTAWTQWNKPILDLLNLTEDHIGYLNLCKNATSANTPPSERMYFSDWEWTRRQLENLRPKVVVAGGLAVAKQLKKLSPEPPAIVLSQNRERSQNQAVRDRQTEMLASAIRKALS